MWLLESSILVKYYSLPHKYDLIKGDSIGSGLLISRFYFESECILSRLCDYFILRTISKMIVVWSDMRDKITIPEDFDMIVVRLCFLEYNILIAQLYFWA